MVAIISKHLVCFRMRGSSEIQAQAGNETKTKMNLTCGVKCLSEKGNYAAQEDYGIMRRVT